MFTKGRRNMLIAHTHLHRIPVILAVLFLVFNFSTMAGADPLSDLSAPDHLQSSLILTKEDISHLFAGDQNEPVPALAPASIGINFGKVHKYLGYSTLLLAGVAAVTSSTKSLHYGAAYATTGTALATCFTGYYEYRDRFDLGNGFLDEDNLHILLGTLGTLGVATAVAIADSGENKSHAAVGITGGASMMVSIIVIKW
jgi:hypothetical protein